MLAELARLVRNGTLSAADLVRESLARIDRYNGPLNAVVGIRPEALREAQDLDIRLRRQRHDDPAAWPLAGLPFLVKDVEDVAGVRTTHGSLLFADAPPARSDSGTVARLRAAGAIPVGKTNTSEFAFEGVTDNRLFGRTVNPWNVEWSPGGSSGGSAAALAAGLVPIATGSDAGGSVRGPAALCGLIGLKPTNGRIGRLGAPEWLDLVTDGIFGIGTEDVALLLEVLAGPQPGDPGAAPVTWAAAPGSVAAGGPGRPRRLLVAPRLQPGPALPADVAALFRAAVVRLEQGLRLPVEPLSPESTFPGDHHPDDDSLTLLGAETVDWLGRNRVLRERDRFDRFFARYVDDALAVDVDAYLAARRRRFEHERRLDDLLADESILVTPTLNVIGLLADGTVPGVDPGLVNALANTNPQNVTGHPAISVPAGLSAEGIPFGLQVTAGRYREDLLLAVAGAWERMAPWPLAAPGYAPFGAQPGDASVRHPSGAA
jgi:Asp-tRNA(Asn)/Glu-tRNA(Gln) amidotransferase A subunit family amidase